MPAVVATRSHGGTRQFGCGAAAELVGSGKWCRAPFVEEMGGLGDAGVGDGVARRNTAIREWGRGGARGGKWCRAPFVEEMGSLGDAGGGDGVAAKNAAVATAEISRARRARLSRGEAARLFGCGAAAEVGGREVNSEGVGRDRGADRAERGW